MVQTISQLGWVNLPHLPILTLPVTGTGRQRVVITPKDQPQEGIDGYRDDITDNIISLYITYYHIQYYSRLHSLLSWNYHFHSKNTPQLH